MSFNLFLNNVATILIVLTPVWTFTIWHLKLNGKTWCVLTTMCFVYMAIMSSIQSPIGLPWAQGGRIPSHLHFYLLFIAIYIVMLTPKFGFNNFHKVLAASLWMVFIAGDLWEVPIFVYSINHINLASVPWVTSHIRRLYTLATFVLFTQMCETRLLNKYSLSLFAVELVLSFIILSPLGFAFFYDAGTLARLVCLSFFGFIIYFGVGDKWI